MDPNSYSGRGVLNALLYDILYAENSDALLRDFLGAAAFPFAPDSSLVGTTTVLIEPSLSDFGASDAVFLIESAAGKKCVVFIEARVGAGWRLAVELSTFKDGARVGGWQRATFPTNIFTQFHHKQQFMRHGLDKLQEGVAFPEWSTKSPRKISSNPAILSAAEKIKSYGEQAFYLMLIPDIGTDTGKFFTETLARARLPEVPNWDISHCGYLTWRAVEDFCRDNNLTKSVAVFRHSGD